MHILVSYAIVGRGGDAVQLLALAEAFRRRGHDVTVVGAHRPAPYAFHTVHARVKGLIRRLPWWAQDAIEIGLTVVSTLKAVRVSQARRVDLIIHRGAAYDFAASGLPRLLQAPMVVYLDAHVAAERAFNGRGYWRCLHAWAMQTLGRSAAMVLTPSQAVADYYHTLGVPKDRILVRRNGVSERHLRQGLEAADAYPPCADPSVCRIGFVGSLSRWHRVDILLDAMRLLRDGRRERTEPVYRLIIIGRGGEYEHLREHARHSRLCDVVEWRGSLSHDDAVLALRNVDIAVLPHTLPTGSPMKLAEYAAMARPIVAPDYPNIRDMFTPAQEIALVPPEDAWALAVAIRRLAADPDLAQRMGRAAQARILGFTWEEMVDLLVRETFWKHEAAVSAGHGQTGPEADPEGEAARGP